jgi:Arc/MetJ-type ribon-helix-helix transcriptional regulator
MQERNEISLRITDKMQRIIESLVDSGMCKTKSEFVAKSVKENIRDIHSSLEGQKNIRDFIKELNSDVEWINMKIPEQSIHPRIEINNDLSCTYRSEINDKDNDVLKESCRCSNFSKSALIRLCIMKKSYDMKDMLSDVKRIKLEDRWNDIDRKLNIMNTMLIDRIYYYFFKEDYIQNKVDGKMEIKNIYYLKEHYKEFKGSSGYKYLENTERGNKIIEVLETIPEVDP